MESDHDRVIYTAPTVEAADSLFDEFAAEREPKYPATIAVRRNSWEKFTPFLKFPAPLSYIQIVRA